MSDPRRPALVILGVLVFANVLAGKASGSAPGASRWDPKAAAAYLDQRATWWLTWSGAARGQKTACLSCHTTLPIALARAGLAPSLGETSPGAAEKRLIGVVEKRVDNWQRVLSGGPASEDAFLPFYSGSRKPSALGTESVLNALVLVTHDRRWERGVLRKSTRKALEHLWEQQQGNGAWLWLEFGLNPWEKDGTYYGAALAALAVGTAGAGYYDAPEIRTKVGGLKSYLRTQFTSQPLHHRLVALWAASRLPGIVSDDDRRKLIEEIQTLQQPDGGWSLAALGRRTPGQAGWQSHGVYPEGTASDGYATGLVVLALKGAGVKDNEPTLHNGVAWLASRQKEGTWPARYPNRPRDPQTDIGKFMRDAATAFAVLALTEARKE